MTARNTAPRLAAQASVSVYESFYGGERIHLLA